MTCPFPPTLPLPPLSPPFHFQGVLSDMNSLDYAVKRVIEMKAATADGNVAGAEASVLQHDAWGNRYRLHSAAAGLGREEFRDILVAGRAGGEVSDGELFACYESPSHSCAIALWRKTWCGFKMFALPIPTWFCIRSSLQKASHSPLSSSLFPVVLGELNMIFDILGQNVEL